MGGVKARGSIASVKDTRNCLAHALVIAMARVENDANYKAYINGRKITLVVNELLARGGIDLSNGGEGYLSCSGLVIVYRSTALRYLMVSRRTICLIVTEQIKRHCICFMMTPLRIIV